MKKNKTPSKKKTKKSEEKKETKLEEEIKEAEEEIKEETQEFFEEPIRQLPLSNQPAPVLERIIQRETPAPIPIEAEREAGEQTPVNYSPTNEPKYGFMRNADKDKEKKYETNFVPPVLTRREFSTDVKREFLKSPQEAWSNQANDWELGDVEFVEEEARLPFEEQQKKYKKAKLR